MMKYIVDRIEGNFAICESEDGTITNINLSLIEEALEEGDIIVKKEDLYYVDREATLRRKKDIEELMKGMWVDE